MQTFYIDDLSKLPDLEANSCIIGNFDGVHKGHRELITKAKQNSYKTLVITFESLKKQNYITSTNQKIKYLEELSIDYLIIFPFKTIEKVFYNEFIDILKKLKVKFITCGKDFRFGFKREGDIIDLKKKFKLTVLEDILSEDIRISTTQIKTLLSDGKIEEANQLLEKPYTITGLVISGNQIGRKLGFPTANIEYNEYLLPKNGVYLTIVKYNDEKYLSMTNIGYNPTLNEQENRRLEVHIIDFDKEIYGEELEISFIKYLREEKKFSSKDELINSLNETINICRERKDMLK